MKMFLSANSMLLALALFGSLAANGQPWTAVAVVVCWTMAMLS